MEIRKNSAMKMGDGLKPVTKAQTKNKANMFRTDPLVPASPSCFQGRGEIRKKCCTNGIWLKS